MASWTLYNFGGYPKCLKWSSQSRPVTKLIKKTRPEGDPKVNPKVNPPPTAYPGRATPAAPPLQSRAKAQCNAMQS